MNRQTHKDIIHNRCIIVGEHIIDNKSTIRETANQLKMSKTSVHDDTRRLKNIDRGLYNKVKKQLDYNNSVKGHRGGCARHKYRGEY